MTGRPLTAAERDVVAGVRRLLVRDLESVRRTVLAYPDDASLWAPLGGLPNCGGTLALHLAGNLRHFIGAVLGGGAYVRDRAREFGARDLSRELVAAEVADAAADVDRVLAGAARGAAGFGGGVTSLDAPFPVPVADVRPPVRDMLLHLATHCAYHLGQLDAHRRGVTGDATGVGAQAIAPLRGD